jgi:hypothetical protein
MAFSKFFRNDGIVKWTSPPDQACLDIRFLGGWVKAQKNQLVILMGMIQAKLRADYSTQVGEAQANYTEVSGEESIFDKAGERRKIRAGDKKGVPLIDERKIEVQLS